MHVYFKSKNLYTLHRMEYDTDLWNSIKMNHPQEALYRVGEHIKNETINILENTWFYALANFGAFMHFNYYKWLDLCKEMYTVLETAEFLIADALSITLKLCFLYKHANMYSIPAKLHIQVLRKKVLGFFSEDLKLSQKGLSQFQHFLPKDEQEREFCIKIVSGLITLWNGKKFQEFRNCLEYIDRKKFEIELPSNVHLKWGSQHYSMNIVLWECLCILEPSFEILKKLYMHHYSRKCHKISMAFLLATHSYLETQVPDKWTEKELMIIQKAIEHSKDIFQQIEEDTPITEDNSGQSKEPTYIFENFFPTSSGLNDTSYINYDNTEINNKTIILKRKGKSKPVKESKIDKLPYE